MKRLWMTALAALVLAGFVAAGPCHAQGSYTYQQPQTSPRYQPAVSPYLNINRAGAPQGVNYSTLVRPQIDNTRAIQQLQLQFQQEQGQFAQPNAFMTADPNALLPYTGHPVQFMTYSHYFTAAANRQQPQQQGRPALGLRR
jgi:hypothetical protein